MTTRRERHRKHANPFSIRGEVPVPDWHAIYGREAPFALDVGFGLAGFLLELARQHPEWNVLGLEIRPHLVAWALRAAYEQGLNNVHAVLSNANAHTTTLVPDRSIAFVAVNFPDPWFKQRHRKRRVVCPEWLAALSPKLLPGADIHAMTDFEPIGRQMLTTFERCPGMTNVNGPGQLATASTTGIMTEREVTHLGRGEPVYRLHFRWTA